MKFVLEFYLKTCISTVFHWKQVQYFLSFGSFSPSFLKASEYSWIFWLFCLECRVVPVFRDTSILAIKVICMSFSTNKRQYSLLNLRFIQAKVEIVSYWNQIKNQSTLHQIMHKANIWSFHSIKNRLSLLFLFHSLSVNEPLIFCRAIYAVSIAFLLHFVLRLPLQL